MHCTKENILGEFLITRHTHIKWAGLFTAEDWLTDIETASELTNESRTKLAQGKSRGLVRTLITEALIAQKSWDEIKDLLHLKISNADIQTSIS